MDFNTQLMYQVVKPRGGGKRGRVDEPVKAVPAPAYIMIPTMQEDDTNESKACLNAGDIDLERVVLGMDAKTIDRFFVAVMENPQTGNMTAFTKAYLPFEKNIAALQDNKLKR